MPTSGTDDRRGPHYGAAGAAARNPDLPLLDTALDRFHEGVFLIDETSRFRFVNLEACRMLGYARADLLRMRLADIDPSFPEHLWDVHLARLKQAGTFTIETRHRTRDGRLLPVEIHASHFMAGSQAFHLAFAREITEQKRSERALRESHSFNAGIISNIHEGIVVLDLDLRYKVWNPYMEKLTGITASAILGRSCLEVFPFLEASGLLERVGRALAGERVETAELEFTIPETGRICWLAETIAALPDSRGESAGLILTVRDITERKEVERQFADLQAQLHQAQKMESLGNLTGGIAHDFNNLLCGILGAAELLRTSGSGLAEPARNGYLDLILATTKRAADLTGKLLAFSRAGRRADVPVDIRGLVEETIAILQRTIDKRIAVALDDQSRAATVAGDAALLQSVFLNMGINASHAMPDGGDLVFALRNVRLDGTDAAGGSHPLAPGEYLHVEVRDTGSGMAPEIQNRIFEPFFTTKGDGKGTGLGLAVAYGTILDHRGAVRVASQVGEGTSFHIHLPVAAAPAPGRAAALESAPGRGTILLVDDEETLLVTIRAMLESLGCTVLTACNGLEAVETVRAGRHGIDLVILDLMMPVMDGHQAFEILQVLDPGLPVLLTSGCLKREEVLELQDRGARGFLRKPFLLAELGRAVGEALAHPGTRGEAPAPGPAAPSTVS